MYVLSILKKNYILVFILLLALSLRVYTISGNNIFFYYDQARDAVVSSSIITDKDIKIQGPSVSGTNDSVYHGVLYYYVIAPAYVLGGGSPFVVSAYLAVISLLGIIVTYKISIEVFKSKTVGLIAAFFQSVSAVSIHLSTWLSNPNLSGIFVPLTYYYIWKIFLSEIKQSKISYIFFGASIALSMQSALQNITIFGSIFIVFIYSIFNKFYKLEVQKLLFSVFTFFVGISTMILTEILMYRRGILSLESLNLNQHETNFFEILPQIASKYYFIISNILVAQKLFVLPIFIVLIALVFIAKMNRKQAILMLVFLLAPLWLLVWHYRDPNHTFIGVETVIFLLLSAGITRLIKQKKQILNLLGFAFLGTFAVANFIQILDWNKQQHHHFGVIQNGAFLNRQLQVVNKTYEIANGSQFSFSSLTSPYAINATWDYLYRWHGQSKYGYTPYYIGIDQKYFITEKVLEQKYQPETLHFIIFEPDTTLSEEIQNDFIKNQYDSFGIFTVDTNYQFGSLKLKQLAQ